MVNFRKASKIHFLRKHPIKNHYIFLEKDFCNKGLI